MAANETKFERASDVEVKAAKKALLKAKKDFALHVGLIEAESEVSVADARATAYVEGPAGLYKRLGKPVLV